MDKLQPLIRHKFWIIFGLTVPIALFAYFSASGKMAEATTAQETKLDSTLSGVPTGDSDPNETYAAGAKVINEEMTKRFETQVQKLWEVQTERMTWPKIMVERVPKKFRGEINKSDRYHYMRAYPAVLERVWERVQPYVGDKRTNPALRDKEVDWPQKVLINGMSLPHAEFDMSAPADNEEIWDAQEDIWLLELIFDAVVRTNAEATFVSDAPVREIDYINLISGSGESSVLATASMGGDGEDMMGMGAGAMGADMAGMMMGGKGGRGGAGALNNIGSVSFNVAEEFGPPVPIPPEEGEGGMGMGGGDEYEMGMGMMGGAGAMAAGMGGMLGGGALQAGMKVQRYMGPDGMDPFEGPYRERGFYMSVLILQEKIPDFLAELSSSPWPIRIGRFQFGPNPYAPQDPSGGRSGFGMAGMGGGRRGDGEDFGGAGMGMAGLGMGGMGMAGMGMGGAGMGMGGMGMGGMGMGGMGMGGMGDMGDGGMGLGGMGMGGMGMGGGTRGTGIKLPPYMMMPTSIPPELRSSTDLVQLDFCGIITLYNPVTDDSVEVVEDGSTEADFEEVLEQAPETPEEAKEMAAEEAAEAAAAAAASPEGAAAAMPFPTANGAPAVNGTPPGDTATTGDTSTPPPATESPVAPATPEESATSDPSAAPADATPSTESPPGAGTNSQ